MLDYVELRKLKLGGIEGYEALCRYNINFFYIYLLIYLSDNGFRINLHAFLYSLGIYELNPFVINLFSILIMFQDVIGPAHYPVHVPLIILKVLEAGTALGM